MLVIHKPEKGNEAKGAVLAPANICGHSENPRKARGVRERRGALMNYYEANCGHNSFGSGPTNPTIKYDWWGRGSCNSISKWGKGEIALPFALKITLYFILIMLIKINP